MDEDAIRKAQGVRLAAVRKAAGFDSARSAAIECNWPESTYRAHENGSRTIGRNDADRYLAGFQRHGAKGYSGAWILYGTGDEPDDSLDDLIKDEPPAIRKEAYRAVRNLLRKAR
jgi:hypothetical protein